MDIHAPHEPVHSLRDFGIHIAIVTVGILIALSLEGILDSVRDHHLVQDTRQDFQFELLNNQQHSHRELARIRSADATLKQLVADLPALEKQHPDQIAPRLYQVSNTGYFLPAEGWQTALSTGALAHMQTAEVQRYANVYYIIRYYADVQRDGRAAEDQANAFFLSHPHPSPADLVTGAERIVLFARAEDAMASVCSQMDDDINKVLPPETPTTNAPSH